MAVVLVNNERDAALSDRLRERGLDVVAASDVAHLDVLLPGADALYANPPTQVDAARIARGARLRVVAAGGAGTDHIDVDAAARAGITVVNAGDAGAASVAEHTIGVMVALAKRLFEADTAVRAGAFDRRWRLSLSELRHKTLGIIGYGNIGRAIAARATAFEMRVLGVARGDASWKTDIARGATRHEVLCESDFVSVNVPLTRETRQSIAAREFALMKPGAFFVNTSRGGVVDEYALAEAIRIGHIAGAAIDVYDTEPPAVANPLLRLPNVIATPHYAGITREAITRMAVSVADRIADALDASPPLDA